MSAPFRPCEGTITIDGSNVGRVTGYSYSQDAETITFFQMGTCNEQSVAGPTRGSGQINVIWDGVDDVGQAALIALLASGVTGALVIRPVGAGVGDPEETGNVTIQGRTHDGEASDIARGTYSFQGVLTPANQ